MEWPSLSPDIIHKFIRDKYSKRFPELESLVPNALDYIRTVKASGGSGSAGLARWGGDLQRVLSYPEGLWGPQQCVGLVALRP